MVVIKTIMASRYPFFMILLVSMMIISVWSGKLDLKASITGGLISISIFLCGDFTGIFMLGAFFILGSAATSWKLKAKQAEGIAELHKGRRTTGQVLANGGIAGFISLICMFFPEHHILLRMLIGASLASATADTLSSELGNVYGTRFYNVVSFKKDRKGLNGVVSMEGTLFGLAGSLVIALIYGGGFGWTAHVAFIIVAGLLGNLVDSILGATLERTGFLNNNAVNFLNTLSGALVAFLLNALWI